MAHPGVPDEGVSFMDYENENYRNYSSSDPARGGTKPPLWNLENYQNPAREHDEWKTYVDNPARERRRHE